MKKPCQKLRRNGVATSSTDGGGVENLKWDSEEFVKTTIPELAGLGEEKTLAEILNEEGALARERVIITYPPEKKDEICKLLGLEKLQKVMYRIEELQK